MVDDFFPLVGMDFPLVGTRGRDTLPTNGLSFCPPMASLMDSSLFDALACDVSATTGAFTGPKKGRYYSPRSAERYFLASAD